MKPTITAVAGLLLGLTLSAVPGQAQSTARTPHVTVSLIPEQLDLAPGAATRLAIRFEIEPGWHLYFAYPGQSGVGTRFVWQLAGGGSVDSLEWPVPERLVTEGLVTQVYQGDFTVATRVHAGSTGQATHLSVAVSWGICRTQCVTDDALLRLTLLAGATRPNPEWASVAPALKHLSRTIPGLTASAVRQGSGLSLILRPAKALPPGAHRLTFYPLDGTVVDTCVVAVPRLSGGNAILALGPAAPNATRLRGLLAGWPTGDGPAGVVVDVAIGK